MPNNTQEKAEYVKILIQQITRLYDQAHKQGPLHNSWAEVEEQEAHKKQRGNVADAGRSRGIRGPLGQRRRRRRYGFRRGSAVVGKIGQDIHVELEPVFAAIWVGAGEVARSFSLQRNTIYAVRIQFDGVAHIARLEFLLAPQLSYTLLCRGVYEPCPTKAQNKYPKKSRKLLFCFFIFPPFVKYVLPFPRYPNGASRVLAEKSELLFSRFSHMICCAGHYAISLPHNALFGTREKRSERIK